MGEMLWMLRLQRLGLFLMRWLLNLYMIVNVVYLKETMNSFMSGGVFVITMAEIEYH